MTEPLGDLPARLRAALEPIPTVRVAYLFGSRAAGRARPDSDLDVAIAFSPGLTTEARELARRAIVGHLTDALGRLGESADIVDLDRVSSAIAFRAIRDGVRVLSRSESDRVRVESAVARRHADDAPRRALFRRAALDAIERMRVHHG